MLLKLPSEIILTVSRFLNIQDKLNLNMTCRKLNELISKTTLYEELESVNYKISAKKLVQLFEKDPMKSTQVKHIILGLDELPSQDLSQLPNIFPNITTFVNLEQFPDSNGFRKPLVPWIDKLEVFETSSGWSPVWHALERYLFPRLAVLKIGRDHLAERNSESYSRSYFLNILKNAPALKTLSLNCYNLNLDFFEQLHKNCPYIETLRLNHDLFTLANNHLPETMAPASSVLNLEMRNIILFGGNRLLQDYILKKYTGLKHLSFTLQYREAEAKQKLYINRRYQSDARPDEDEHSILVSNFRSALEYYRISAPTFFSSLPKTIKSLEVDANTLNTILPALIESKLKLVKLQVIKPSAADTGTDIEPIQLSNIKHFLSLKIMEIELSLTVRLFDNPEVISTNMTSLTIYVDGNPIYMDSILSAFPFLLYLSVTGSKKTMMQVYDDSREKNDRKIYPDLRRLNLSSVTFHQSSFEVLQSITPNLKVFDLKSAIIIESTTTKRDYHLDLSCWKLSKCDLYIYERSYLQLYQHLKLTIENTTKILPNPYRNKGRFGFPFTRPSDVESTTPFSIKFGHLDNIRICERQVRKNGDDIMIAEYPPQSNYFLK